MPEVRELVLDVAAMAAVVAVVDRTVPLDDVQVVSVRQDDADGQLQVAVQVPEGASQGVSRAHPR